MAGLISPVKPATAEEQKICDQVKQEAERKTGKSFPMFKAVQFQDQVIAGTNFFIKVYVGDDTYVHLTVFRPLGQAGGLHLVSIQQDKLEHEPIQAHA